MSRIASGSAIAGERGIAAPAQTLMQRVFRTLADGAWHSGEQLAAAESISRSAVGKAVGALRRQGLAVEALARRGYRLPAPQLPLDATRIRAQLGPEARALLRNAEVAWSLPSTNGTLLARGERAGRGAPPAGQFDFLAAEYQTAGRGRRSRQWFAPPGGALCLSLGRSFAVLPKDAAALSLAVGVCARRALAHFTQPLVQLKWPNDLLADGRKLGGILIELRADGTGPAYAVIGIGINCALGAASTRRVRGAGTEPIDLAALGVEVCDRNRLAAVLISEIVAGVLEFERHGLAAFASEWREADALAGRVVSVNMPGGDFVGRARGVAADGALCVERDGAVRQFYSGEVSVRAQP